MGKILCRVTLTSSEIELLTKLTKSGKHFSRKVLHSLILLNADEGEFSSNGKRSNKEIADFLHVGESMVERIKKRFVEEGVESALEDKASNGITPVRRMGIWRQN